ncbi:hypothetical protein MX850_09310 [Erysipelothrix sp. Poltava]|nr:hypothetical protein MX850_09310 [Erysipelothrix sp. Poltava]
MLKEGLASIDSGSKVEKVNKSLHNSMDQMDKIVKALSKPQSVLPANLGLLQVVFVFMDYY